MMAHFGAFLLLGVLFLNTFIHGGAVHVDGTRLVQEVPANMLDVALLLEGRRCR